MMMFHASQITVHESMMKKNPIVPTRWVTKSASFWVGFSWSWKVSLGFLTLEKCFWRSWTESVIWLPRSLLSAGCASSATVHHPLCYPCDSNRVLLPRNACTFCPGQVIEADNRLIETVAGYMKLRNERRSNCEASRARACSLLRGHHRGEPVQHALVIEAPGPRLAVPVGAFLSGEAHDGPGALERVLHLLRLAGPELLVVRVGDKHGALDLLDDVGGVVLPRLVHPVEVAFGAVRLHPPEDALTRRLAAHLQSLVHQVVEGLLVPGVQQVEHLLGSLAFGGLEHVHDAGIDDARGDAMLEGQGAQDPVAALAYAGQSDPARVHVLALQ